MEAEIKGLRRDCEHIEQLVIKIRQIDRTACLDDYASVMTENETLNDLLKAMKKAGFFQKRKVKKEVQNTGSRLRKGIEELRKCLFQTYHTIWNDLNDMSKEIAVVVPDVTTGIQKFHLPHGPAAKDLIEFGMEFSGFYLDMLSRFRDEAKSVLEKNKETIDRYSKYISIDPTSVTSTEKTTIEAIGLMGIRENLDLLHTLTSEAKNIHSARKGVEDKIQMAIVKQATGLIELLETCDSIGIDYESTLDLRTQATWVVEQAHGTESVDDLFELERRINSLNKDFVNTLRAKNFALKSDTEKEVSRLSAIVQGREIDDLIPKPPHVDMGSSNVLELIRGIESMRTWQKKTLIGMKRAVNSNELLTVVKTAQAMNIKLPSKIQKKIRSAADKIEGLNDLGETVSAIREYLRFQTEVIDAMRSHVLKTVDSDEYRTVSAILEPPSLSFETTDPTAMLSQLRESEKWLSDVTDRLRDSSKVVGETLLRMEEVQSFGISFPPEVHPDLIRVRDEIVHEDSFRSLVDLWKEYEEGLEKIRLTIYLFIKKSLESPVVRRLITSIRDINSPFDEIERDDLQKQIKALGKLKRWKDQVITQLHSRLTDESIPAVPMEHPFDLKNRKKDIVRILEKGTAAEEFEETIQAYFDYQEGKTKTREQLIEEISVVQAKNKDIIEKARKILGTASSGLSISLEFDDSMSYENALQMWWDLQRLISNKVDRLVDISNSRLLSTAEDFMTLPEPWVSYFEALSEYVDKQVSEIQKMSGMEEILQKYDLAIREIHSLATSGVENMRGRMHTSLSVSISQISEIIQIPVDVKTSIEWIRDMDPNLETSEQIARIARELILNYENEIIAPLTEILMNESKMVISYINDLKTAGIDILKYVADNVKKSSEILTVAEKITMKDIAEVFSLLSDIKFNPSVARVVREQGKETIEDVRKAVELTASLLGAETENRFKDLASNLAHSEQALSAEDLGVLCTQYMYIVQIADNVRQTIVSLESEEFRKLNEHLGMKLQYYSSILAVFEKYPEPTSRDIFPYVTLKQKRELLEETISLKTAGELLTEIYDLRNEWEDEIAPSLNRWHKALRMFISLVQPTKNRDENRRQLEEIRKRINNTYTDRPLQSYIYHAVKHYIESMPMEDEDENL